MIDATKPGPSDTPEASLAVAEAILDPDAYLAKANGMLDAAGVPYRFRRFNLEECESVLTTPTADSSEAGRSGEREALKNLLAYAERNECAHEETHRGGAIWTICDSCGEKWADDRGGFIPYCEPVEFTQARAALSAPVGEPVPAAWRLIWPDGRHSYYSEQPPKLIDAEPLYAHPPAHAVGAVAYEFEFNDGAGWKRRLDFVHPSKIFSDLNDFRNVVEFGPLSAVGAAQILEFSDALSSPSSILAQMKEALEFYADPTRYNGANQRNDSDDKWSGGNAYLKDVTRDHGEIARRALSPQGPSGETGGER